MMVNGLPAEATLACINHCIAIQEELEKLSKQPKAELGRYYYFRGTVYQGLERDVEKVESFKKAHDILKNYPEFQELTQELLSHIEEAGHEPETDGEQVEVKESGLGSVVAIASIGVLITAAAFAFFKLRRT